MSTTEKEFLPRVFLDIAQCPPEFFGNPDGKPEYGYTQGFEFKKTNANDKEYLSVSEHEAKMVAVREKLDKVILHLLDNRTEKALAILDEVLAMGKV